MQIINTSSCYPTALKDSLSDNDEMTNNKDTSGSSLSSNAATAQVYPSVVVYIKSISEFPLSSGILSFSIVDAAVRRYKCANDNYMCEELDDYDEETSSIYCVVVHMYIVQSKSMQECHILYQPTVEDNVEVKSTMSSSDTSGGLSRINNNSNKTMPSNEIHEQVVDTDLNDNDEDDNVGDEDEENEIVGNAPLIKDESSLNEQSALELLLGITSATAVSNTNLASSSGGSTVVAVAAAAAAAPSVIATESLEDSRNSSPKISSSSAGKSFTQVNLMTPDAFTSTSSTNGK